MPEDNDTIRRWQAIDDFQPPDLHRFEDCDDCEISRQWWKVMQKISNWTSYVPQQTDQQNSIFVITHFPFEQIRENLWKSKENLENF